MPRAFIPEFDGLRGLLSLLVLTGHIAAAHSLEHPFEWFGGSMEVFFCLSGFLISSIILNKYQSSSGLDLRAYFLNRALRIWPAYFFAYAVILTLTLSTEQHLMYGTWEDNRVPSVYGLLAPLFFVQNVELGWGSPRDAYVAMFDHSWSVAIEEQFYLIVPLIVLALRGRTPQFVATVLLSLVLLSGIQRANNESIWLLTSRLDPFVLGAGLYFVYARARMNPDARAHRRIATLMMVAVIMAIALLLPAVISTYTRIPVKEAFGRLPAKTVFEPMILFSVLAFGLLGHLLFGTQSSALHRLLRLRPLRELGQISYSTYLLHVPVVYCVCPLLSKWLGFGTFVTIAISPPITILAAFLSNRLIERPFMALRRTDALAHDHRAPAMA